MIKQEMAKLHKEHRKYLFDHSPVDRMIEDQGISANWNGNVESRYVASAGGDVSLWVVTGWTPETFSLYQK